MHSRHVSIAEMIFQIEGHPREAYCELNMLGTTHWCDSGELPQLRPAAPAGPRARPQARKVSSNVCCRLFVVH